MIQNANLQLEDGLEDLIRVDVKRSFTQDKNFPRQKLFNILKCGALALNKGASYCQGMNYICGFFLKQIEDENECFDYYVSTIQNKMNDIFNENFKKLQGYFYVLDNLIKLFLPKLSVHFKSVSLQSVYFSSSWFITIFTSSLQYTKKSYLVLYIWDMFLAEGYKAVFKSIICILDFYQKKLLNMGFEEILEFLGSVIEQEIFINTKFEQFLELKKSEKDEDFIKKNINFYNEYNFVLNFKKSCQKFKIKNSLIFRLETRYNALNKKIKKKL